MRVARASMQIPLLIIDPVLDAWNNASARNAYGMAAQIIACERLSLLPIAIDGRCQICPDAEKEGIFYEIKSAHKNGKVVIYDWRLQKELASRLPLYYCIVIHKLRGARKNILPMLRESVVVIKIFSVQTIAIIAKRYPLNIPRPVGNDPRTGYNRKGYIQGYRNVPVKDLP